MNEHPLSFQTEMIRAVLDERKTQTRRLRNLEQVNEAPDKWILKEVGVLKDYVYSKYQGRFGAYFEGKETPFVCPIPCPYGQPGDRLWVKETYADAPNGYVYRANFNDGHGQEVIDLPTGATIPLVWKSSRFMPRKASRITLEIKGISIERLKDIRYFQIMQEGAPISTYPHHHDGYETNLYWWFHELWNSINAKSGFGWDFNPWCWVVEFHKVQL